MCREAEYYPIKNSDGFLLVRWSEIPIMGRVTTEAKRNMEKLIIEVLDPLAIAFEERVIISRCYDEYAIGKDRPHSTGFAVDLECVDDSMLKDVRYFLKSYKGSVVQTEYNPTTRRRWVHFELKEKCNKQ